MRDGLIAHVRNWHLADMYAGAELTALRGKADDPLSASNVR